MYQAENSHSFQQGEYLQCGYFHPLEEQYVQVSNFNITPNPNICKKSV